MVPIGTKGETRGGVRVFETKIVSRDEMLGCTFAIHFEVEPENQVEYTRNSYKKGGRLFMQNFNRVSREVH